MTPGLLRRLMEDAGEEQRRLDLRNSFHFAYFAQFCYHFDTISGDDFHLRELEDAFLEPEGQKISYLWRRFLKHFPTRPNSSDPVFESIKREYRKRDIDPPSNDTELKNRLKISFDLCNFIVENGDNFMRQVLRGEDDLWGGWRNEPVGTDTKGRIYWVLAEGRLYRECKDWELLAYDMVTWRSFLETPGLSNKPADRKLLAILRDEIFPETEPLLLEEERRIRKHRPLDHLPVKRSSRLQEKQLQQMLEEEKQRAEEAERQQALKESLFRNPPTEVVATEVRKTFSREERIAMREMRLMQQHIAEIESEVESEINVDSDEATPLVSEIAEPNPSSPLKLVFRPLSSGGYESSIVEEDT